MTVPVTPRLSLYFRRYPAHKSTGLARYVRPHVQLDIEADEVLHAPLLEPRDDRQEDGTARLSTRRSSLSLALATGEGAQGDTEKVAQNAPRNRWRAPTLSGSFSWCITEIVKDVTLEVDALTAV